MSLPTPYVQLTPRVLQLPFQPDGVVQDAAAAHDAQHPERTFFERHAERRRVLCGNGVSYADLAPPYCFRYGSAFTDIYGFKGFSVHDEAQVLPRHGKGPQDQWRDFFGPALGKLISACVPVPINGSVPRYSASVAIIHPESPDRLQAFFRLSQSPALLIELFTKTSIK